MFSYYRPTRIAFELGVKLRLIGSPGLRFPESDNVARNACAKSTREMCGLPAYVRTFLEITPPLLMVTTGAGAPCFAAASTPRFKLMFCHLRRPGTVLAVKVVPRSSNPG